MCDGLWAEVARRVDGDRPDTVVRCAERVEATAEVFTPTALAVELVRAIPAPMLGPGRTVFDPACGDGQFLSAAKWAKVLVHGMDEESALADLYGVDIMADNVEVCRQRLGGGTIVVGDALAPHRLVEGQSAWDVATMLALFAPRGNQQSLFGA
jgi:hypothetical protein